VASYQRVTGAYDRLHVGLIGCDGRGSFDTRLIRGPERTLKLSRLRTTMTATWIHA
jgi:hypothetical protein